MTTIFIRTSRLDQNALTLHKKVLACFSIWPHYPFAYCEQVSGQQSNVIEVYGVTPFHSRSCILFWLAPSQKTKKVSTAKEAMAPSGSASSSSGFSSSDEDDAEHEQMQYERITTTASVSVTSVPVDVIEEEIENDTVAPSTAFTTSLDDDDDEAQLQEADLSALALHVDAQCMATATPLLQGSLSFHYEQFTTAIELVTASWPVTTEDDGDDDEAQDPKAMAYRALRAALYARFQRAFPLTPEMYAQWLSDLSERDLRAKQRVFELSARDYQSVALALQYAQFLHGNGSERATHRFMHD